MNIVYLAETYGDAMPKDGQSIAMTRCCLKLNHQMAGLFNAGTQAHDPWTVVILASFKD